MFVMRCIDYSLSVPEVMGALPASTCDGEPAMALLPYLIAISFLLSDKTSLDPETMLRPRMLEITFSLTGCPVLES